MRFTSLLTLTEIILLATITTSLSPIQPLRLTIQTLPIFHQRPSTNSIVKAPFKLGAIEKIDDAPANDIPPTSTTSEYAEDNPVDNSFMSLPEPQLSPDEDKALREVLKGLQKDGKTKDLRWFDRSDVWTEAKATYPVLSSYTDAQLRRAYFAQKSSLVDVILYTPVGPVFALNILAWYFHFSWCDTPIRSLLGSSCGVST